MTQEDFFKDYKELSAGEFFTSHQFYEVCREAAYRWDEMRPTWRKRLWWRLTRNIGPTSAFRRRFK